MSKREPSIGLFVGARGHGKSTKLAAYLEKHRYKNAIVFKEGVNVHDKAFESWPKISLDQYKGGRVIVDGGTIEAKNPYIHFIQTVHKKFTRGVIVIDDAAMYEINDITKELRPLLTDCRRMFVEIIFVFHGLSDIPIRLFNYVNYITLFHTNGNPAYKLSKIPNFELLMAAKDVLAQKAARGEKYSHITIKLSD